jgi:hypothetical protein
MKYLIAIAILVCFLSLYKGLWHSSQPDIWRLKWVKTKLPVQNRPPEIIEVPDEAAILAPTAPKHIEIIKKNRQKWQFNFYEVICYDCGGPNEVPFDKVSRYKKFQPYQVSQKNTPDSLYIDFTFIESCCQEYTGYIDLAADTLKLYYGRAKEDMCLCFCEYTYRFALPKAKFRGKIRFMKFKDRIW